MGESFVDCYVKCMTQYRKDWNNKVIRDKSGQCVIPSNETASNEKETNDKGSNTQ